MTAPLIHGPRGFVPASKLLDAIGGSLQSIKDEDGLTWADMGEALGKSDDQAGKYALAMATMDALTFLRACQQWKGRFANRVFAQIGFDLCESTGSSTREIREGVLALMELATGLQRALLDDGDVSDDELIELGNMVEQCGDLVASLRRKLALIVGERAAKRNV